jgi:hypothetical protein
MYNFEFHFIMKNLLNTIVLLFVFANMISSVTFAQNNPVDSSRSKHWNLSISANGIFLNGNTNKIYGSMKTEIKRKDKILETILVVLYGYGEQDNKKDESLFYSSLTADLFYENNLSPFILQYTEFNYSLNIDLRSQTGLGFKYTFFKDKSKIFKASLSLATIYDYTNYTDISGYTDRKTARLSSRLKAKIILFEGKISLQNITFYQPSFKELNDAIWKSETKAEFPLSDVLSVNATYIYTYEFYVPAGKKNRDHRITFGFDLNTGF